MFNDAIIAYQTSSFETGYLLVRCRSRGIPGIGGADPAASKAQARKTLNLVFEKILKPAIGNGRIDRLDAKAVAGDAF